MRLEYSDRLSRGDLLALPRPPQPQQPVPAPPHSRRLGALVAPDRLLRPAACGERPRRRGLHHTAALLRALCRPFGGSALRVPDRCRGVPGLERGGRAGRAAGPSSEAARRLGLPDRPLWAAHAPVVLRDGGPAPRRAHGQGRAGLLRPPLGLPLDSRGEDISVYRWDRDREVVAVRGLSWMHRLRQLAWCRCHWYDGWKRAGALPDIPVDPRGSSREYTIGTVLFGGPVDAGCAFAWCRCVGSGILHGAVVVRHLPGRAFHWGATTDRVRPPVDGRRAH
mmetsp:Transcript_75470/g.213493  ORF Transcript_75470/g.213493 Transcript_75470/m.213493 type:complete len:280 (-) Transcript_75470:599-1438(-)